MLSNKENQRKFKERMYKAGLKQIILWVRRMEKKRTAKMKQGELLKKLKKLTAGWTDSEISDLYAIFIRITEGKEVIKKINK